MMDAPTDIDPGEAAAYCIGVGSGVVLGVKGWGLGGLATSRQQLNNMTLHAGYG